MAIRDRDIAAEIIGVRPMRPSPGLSDQLLLLRDAGAEFVFLYLGSAETLAFDIGLSFLVLFMVIIGGLGSVLGSFLGAGSSCWWRSPHQRAPHPRPEDPVALQKQIELMVFRRAHHLLPDRGAARAGAAVANHQGEASPVAVPSLMLSKEDARKLC